MTMNVGCRRSRGTRRGWSNSRELPNKRGLNVNSTETMTEEIETLKAQLRERERQLRVMDGLYVRMRKMVRRALDDKEASNQIAIEVNNLPWLKEEGSS
jgi:CRISPR/Cas system CSM-associated protein Csm2 small subunit